MNNLAGIRQARLEWKRLFVVASVFNVALITWTLSGVQLGASSGGAIKEFSCKALSQPPPFPHSFWFVKVPKVGGSTLSGVMRSVCAHYDVFCLNPPEGKLRYTTESLSQRVREARHIGAAHVAVSNHMPLSDASIAALDGHPFLFTVLRHPLARVYSMVHFLCLKTGTPQKCATLDKERVLSYARQAKNFYGLESSNLQYSYIKGNATSPREAVNKYDFVFVNEHLDATLVLFMITYQLSYRDIAYIPSKIHTGSYTVPDDEELAQTIMDLNQDDLDAYNIAMQSFKDRVRTVEERCGRGAFEQALATFRVIQDKISRTCTKYKDWYARHGFTTYLNRWGDNGKGPRCVEHVVDSIMRGEA